MHDIKYATAYFFGGPKRVGQFFFRRFSVIVQRFAVIQYVGRQTPMRIFVCVHLRQRSVANGCHKQAKDGLDGRGVWHQRALAIMRMGNVLNQPSIQDTSSVRRLLLS